MLPKTVAIAASISMCVCLSAAPSSAQTADYQPPLSNDGHPDLQGVWTNASITTLERSERYKSCVLRPDDVEAATAAHPQVVRQATDDNQKLSDGLLDGSDLARGRGYNAFWIDPGMRFGVVKGETRTAWIVDPPDGRLPPLTPEAQHRAVELTRHRAAEIEYWPTHDPTLAGGSRENRLAAYREVRDALAQRIRERFGENGA